MAIGVMKLSLVAESAKLLRKHTFHLIKVDVNRSLSRRALGTLILKSPQQVKGEPHRLPVCVSEWLWLVSRQENTSLFTKA